MVKKIVWLSLLALVLLLALQSVSASEMDLNDAYASNLDDSQIVTSVGLDNSNENDAISNSNGEGTIAQEDVESGDDGNADLEIQSENAEAKNRNSTAISADPVAFDYSSGVKLNISLKNGNGFGLSNKTIFVQIKNSLSNLTTDEKGMAVFKYSNSAGSYSVKISFKGDEYYAPSDMSTKISISKSSTKLKVPNVRSYLTSATYVLATLTDSKGHALANKKVSLVVSGKTYNATTNGSGIAKVRIPTKVGNFTLSVRFAGDANYTASSASSKAVITKMITHLSVPVVNSYMTRNTYLKIAFKDIYGNALANKTISVILPKKTFNLRTDANGVAKLKFRKKLGTFKCTIKFKPTNYYYGATSSSKVVISKTPTVIKAPKITLNSTKYGKLSINLTDIDGKALANKEISISIVSTKKVFKVKTNGNGIATLKYNGPRTCDILVKYAGDKNYAARTVKSQFVIHSVKVKFNDVVGAAELLRDYIAENKSLPSSITYKNNTFTPAQLSYLMSVAINHISKSNKNDIVLVAVASPNSSGEIYDTVYKKDYLKIVNTAAGSSINHKTYGYIKHSIYKVPYKVYTASFSRILAFYKYNKKLPNYSLFTNSEYKKVSNSGKYTFYLTTDNIAGKKSDLKMLKSLASALKSKGYEVVIVGIGPDIHNVAYRYGCTGKNSVLLCCFGGVDVGCIEEWTGELSVNNRVFLDNYDGAHVLALWYTKPYGSSADLNKPVGRAWDANYGFALKNPAKYMASHNISYMETGTVSSACALLKAGKMGGPKLIK